MNLHLNWLIAFSAIAVAAAVILFFFIRGRKSKDSSFRSLKSQDGSGISHDNEHVFIPQPGVRESEDHGAPDIQVVDVTHLERPSPERPVTDEDAALIDIIRQSPELPSAIIELSHMLRDPSTNIRRVVELISTDPVLSARVLRVVNSAAYGPSRVTSLQQAVVLLGFNNIWLLVTQMLASSAVRPFAQLQDEDMKGLWRHAAAVSVCAKHLLFNTGLATSEIAPTVFTCSLLHDVGKFLLRGLGGPQGENEEDVADCSMFSVLGEEKFYGIDHCRMGYLLSTYWKLPELICTTIGYHHHPSFANWHEIPKHARRTVAFVAISDCLARKAGYWEQSACAFLISSQVLNIAGLDKIQSLNKLLTKDLMRDLRQTEALIEAAATEV